MRFTITILVLCSFVAATAQTQKRKIGDPLDHLPENIRVLTHFGERADFSPDNKRIAFMAKSFGDAMVYDLKTGSIECLTCHIPAAVFLRVMHLVTGDYILVGPEKFEDITISRSRDNDLWFLSKEKGSKPVKLGIKIYEGLAVSKTSLKIAFSQVHAQSDDVPAGTSRLVTAELDITGSTPKIVNQKTIYSSVDSACLLEAQDFYENDSKMTFTCYDLNHMGSVMGIDLTTGTIINFSKNPGTFEECEGIFLDGKYALIESDQQCGQLGGNRGTANIDIWKLKLDGTGKDFVRLTNFNDYEGGKASNPVASTDGKYMAFQLGNANAPTGVGFGILLYTFSK